MGWKIGGVLTLVLAGVAALVSATTPAEYKTGIEWGSRRSSLSWRFCASGVVRRQAQGRRQNKKTGMKRICPTRTFNRYRRGTPVLSSVPVILDDGEQAHSSRRRDVISRRRRPSAGPVAAAGSAFALRRACLSVPAAGPVRRFMMTSLTPSPAVWF